MSSRGANGKPDPSQGAGSAPEPVDEVNEAVAEEARRGVRFVLPFVLPVLYVVTDVLGPAADRPMVRAAVWAEVGIVVGRWAMLTILSPQSHRSSRARARVFSLCFIVSAWAVSAGFAAIYVAAAPMLDAIQVLVLTVPATAICTVAIMSTSASLPAYIGYVVIHLAGLTVAIVRAHDERLTRMPYIVALLAICLVAIGTRSNRALREKIRLGLRLRDSSMRDALTGLRNRSFVTEHAAHLATRTVDEWLGGGGRRRVLQKRSLALFIVDIDHFKKVNDTYGHGVGDAVLVAFAKIAQSAVRAPDVVSRWGGEEFLFVVEVTERESVAMIGERIRQRVAAQLVSVANAENVRVTCSVGACLFPFDIEHPDALSWEETLVLADGALYEAKRSGRNRCVWLLPGPEKMPPKEALALARQGVSKALEAGAVVTEGSIEVLYAR